MDFMAMLFKTEKMYFILLVTRTNPLFSVFSFSCDSESGRTMHNIFPNTPARPDCHTSPLALRVNTQHVAKSTTSHDGMDLEMSVLRRQEAVLKLQKEYYKLKL